LPANQIEALEKLKAHLLDLGAKLVFDLIGSRRDHPLDLIERLISNLTDCSANGFDHMRALAQKRLPDDTGPVDLLRAGGIKAPRLAIGLRPWPLGAPACDFILTGLIR
jgi:hypothetical protein